MSNFLGMSLKIRSMIHMAAEPIPFFWPMRTFIHHNPLHGLEHLPFPEALEQGSKLFHGRSYLPRSTYQGYLREGKIDRGVLAAEIGAFLAGRENTTGLALQHWLMALLTETRQPLSPAVTLADATDIHALLRNGEEGGCDTPLQSDHSLHELTEQLRQRLLVDCPVYEAVDALYGTQLGEELDTLLIKAASTFLTKASPLGECRGANRAFSTLGGNWRCTIFRCCNAPGRYAAFWAKPIRWKASSPTRWGNWAFPKTTGWGISPASWRVCTAGSVSSAGVPAPNVITGTRNTPAT